MGRDQGCRIPVGLVRTDHAEPSVFQPESLLREARRQRRRNEQPIPDVCLLDPDGDVVRWLQQTGRGRRSDSWACYHTDLWETEVEDGPVGVIGNAVGAPFAVLVDRAWRGEGTSYAYLPPSLYADGDAHLLAAVSKELQRAGIEAIRGGTWTTDAPFRETRSALDAVAAEGLKAVEMEVAGLYAFAQARTKPVVCFALVTNQMAQVEGDFEKGADDGAEHALSLVAAAARGWRALRDDRCMGDDTEETA
jgi:hypothetical protein